MTTWNIASFFLTLFSILFFLNNPTFSQFHRNGIVAHRGVWKNTGIPQNSIEGLKKAQNLGFAGAEFDVNLTLDKVPVVNHDEDFKGVSIEEHTYEELLEKRLDNGESIPTLEEYLRVVKEKSDFFVVLDVKASKTGAWQTVRTARYAAEIVKKMKMQNQVMYICPVYSALLKVLQVDPNARVSYSESDIDPKTLKKMGFYGVQMDYRRFNSGEYSLKESKAEGLIVSCYVVNNEKDMRDQYLKGFDYIFSDEPELLMKVFKNELLNGN